MNTDDLKILTNGHAYRHLVDNDFTTAYHNHKKSLCNKAKVRTVYTEDGFRFDDRKVADFQGVENHSTKKRRWCDDCLEILENLEKNGWCDNPDCFCAAIDCRGMCKECLDEAGDNAGVRPLLIE